MNKLRYTLNTQNLKLIWKIFIDIYSVVITDLSHEMQRNEQEEQDG